MPVGAGSIKRAAKLNAEGGKAAESKKVEAATEAEVKAEATEGKTADNKGAETKSAEKTSATEKKVSAKKTAIAEAKAVSKKTANRKSTVEKAAAEKATAAKKTTRKAAAKKSATDNKTITAVEEATNSTAAGNEKAVAGTAEKANMAGCIPEPKRLGSDPACHLTEEMPVYLL